MYRSNDALTSPSLPYNPSSFSPPLYPLTPQVGNTIEIGIGDGEMSA